MFLSFYLYSHICVSLVSKDRNVNILASFVSMSMCFNCACLDLCNSVDVAGEQWDGDTEWTPFSNAWESGPETAARGQRWLPTGTETVQLVAAVRHPPYSPSLFHLSACPPVHPSVSVSLSPSPLCDLSRSSCPFSTSSFDFFDFHPFLFPHICASSIFSLHSL